MKTNIKYTLVLSLLISSLFTWAQEDINHNVVVMKSYSPVIGDANKLNEQPEIIDTAKVDPNFKYNISSVPFFPTFTPQPIKAAKMVGQPLKKLYHNYALLGFGNYTKPVFEYRYATKRSKDLLAGINLKHLSQNGKLNLEDVDDKVNTAYSRNHANIFLHRMFKESVLQSDLTYNRHTLRQYGHNGQTDTIINKDDNKQVYSWMNATLRYKTTRLDSSTLNYNVFLDYNYFEDHYSTFLNDVGVGGDFSLFWNEELIRLNMDIRHYNHLCPERLYSNTMYHFNPNVKIRKDHWGLEAGLNFDIDANNDGSLFHVYPKIEFHYNIIDYFLVPYFGITGSKSSNNYRKMAQENPYLKPGLITKNTNNFLVFKGGIRGNFTDKISYNLKATYSFIDDAYFFTNDSSNVTENLFVVEYDDVERLDVDAELSWAKSKKLAFTLFGKYHSFKLDEVEHAWHIPDYEFIFNTNYNLKSKILVDFDMFVKGERFAKTYYKTGILGTPDVIKVPVTFDISLGVEYRYTKMLSGFLRVNNLLARKNYLWNYYPTEGLNVMAGVIYSF